MLNDYQQTRLSRNVTIAQYRALEKAQDRPKIAKFVHDRFAERYVVPLERVALASKHGFCVMAISCLMIEALESFRQGWPDTKNKSEQAFRIFFSRPQNQALAVFSDHAEGFYKNIRCGIHHQAETTGGWRIRRCGPLFDANAKTVNATEFLQNLKACLENYCKELRQADWDHRIWINLRTKMDAICNNCIPQQSNR